MGKTTLIKQLSKELEQRRPVGFYTTEIREGGVRKGFEMVSLSGEKGILSHVEIRSPFRVGKYAVDIPAFDNFLDSIEFLSPATRLIIIDEIGKMECFSERFSAILKEILDSNKSVIATIALKGGGLIKETKKRADVTLIEINRRNRDSLSTEIKKILLNKTMDK